MNTLEATRYEVETLTARIAENEKVWGSGCRPELRARLVNARAAVVAAERATAVRVLEGRSVSGIQFREGLKVHADDDFGQPVCGAWDRSNPENSGWRIRGLDGRSFVGRPDACGRCAASLWAWVKED